MGSAAETVKVSRVHGPDQGGVGARRDRKGGGKDTAKKGTEGNRSVGRIYIHSLSLYPLPHFEDHRHSATRALGGGKMTINNIALPSSLPILRSKKHQSKKVQSKKMRPLPLSFSFPFSVHPVTRTWRENNQVKRSTDTSSTELRDEETTHPCTIQYKETDDARSFFFPPPTTTTSPKQEDATSPAVSLLSYPSHRGEEEPRLEGERIESRRRRRCLSRISQPFRPSYHAIPLLRSWVENITT